MIFVTVGSQLPFDRLVKMVDNWAENNEEHKIVAQIGDSDCNTLSFSSCPSMSPDEYNQTFNEADLIISHVGMGTIITAIECNKPLLILPRLTNLGEVRNDHQLATAKYFSNYNNITVVNNEDEFLIAMECMVNKSIDIEKQEINAVSDTLICTLQAFVSGS